MAPVLLNVRVTVSAYKKLVGWRSQVENALAVLPGRSLRDATDDDLDLVASCFKPLDGQQRMGTTFAKVLHRKRPELLPLYDQNVWRCYSLDRVPQEKDRQWSDYFRLLVEEMRSDLQEADESWRAICVTADNVSDGPPLTPLRALDILAWWPRGESDV